VELTILICVITAGIGPLWGIEMATKGRGGQTIHTENEFDRIYAFYEKLEQQERQPRLAWLIVLCSTIVVLMIAIGLFSTHRI
jgi:hypothetical protein